MLNISKNSIRHLVDVTQTEAYQQNKLPKANRMLAWWSLSFLFLILIIFFLPWTQNIQMKGKVTTLRPEQRPQEVNTTIGGRIEKWYVREGDLVEAGDTIVFLSEVKDEYFNPNLLERTANQVNAKEGSISNYQSTARALEEQIKALRQELVFKKGQLENKIKQTQFKQISFEADLEQAKLDYEIAEYQYRRMDTLYQKGIKSLSDLENKRLSMQKASAKLVSTRNKVQENENELNIVNLQFQAIDNEYNNKIAKAESDRYKILSTMYESKGDLNKLQNQYENYNLRNKFYFILAPQSGYITKTQKSGIGEFLKQGETIVTIVPYERELAVEMYLRPMDLPLINLGQEVRLIFDGWQAFIISGWSDFSFGTYKGEVVAIDNIPNANSKYRILVKSNDETRPFPGLLRVGAGVQGIALLQDVPVWYEIWRQLNGFPADFYQNDIEKETKFKPPVKAIAK